MSMNMKAMTIIQPTERRGRKWGMSEWSVGGSACYPFK